MRNLKHHSIDPGDKGRNIMVNTTIFFGPDMIELNTWNNVQKISVIFKHNTYATLATVLSR